MICESEVTNREEKMAGGYLSGIGEKMCVQVFMRKPDGKKSYGRNKYRWSNINEIYLQEIRSGGDFN